VRYILPQTRISFEQRVKYQVKLGKNLFCTLILFIFIYSARKIGFLHVNSTKKGYFTCKAEKGGFAFLFGKNVNKSAEGLIIYNRKKRDFYINKYFSL
jgi:hypothetical protein